MFRDDDFGLRQLRQIALEFPEAVEKISWGRPAFCAPKIFAMYGGNAKGSPGRSAPARRKTDGDMTPYSHSVLVKVDESDRKALEHDKRFYFPVYMGPSGWLGLDLTAAQVDWDEVRELVDASYRLVAPKRLVRLLDAQA